MFRWTRTPGLQNETKGYGSGPPRPSHVLSFFLSLLGLRYTLKQNIIKQHVI
jgi:hypothetical protein